MDSFHGGVPLSEHEKTLDGTMEMFVCEKDE